MNTNTEAATTADAQGVNVQMLHLVKRLLMNAPAVCWQPNLEEANELIAAIRADERAKVEREWQLRVQKLHRRAQAAESNVNKLECFRDGLGKTAAEQIRQLHKHSQALWRACERGGAEIVALRALWEKMRPFLNGVAETDTDDEHYLQHGYWHQRTLKTHEIKAAREVLATMDAARGGGDKCV